MGQATSKNTVNDVTNQLMSVTNSVAQTCFTPVNAYQGNVLNISGPGTVVNGATINLNQAATLNSSCVLSNTTTNDLSNALKQKVSQAAQTTSTSLNLSGATAQNVTNDITNLATQIHNSYTGKCGGALSATQLQTANISNGAQVNNLVINQNQTLQALTNCIMNDSNVTKAQQQLQQDLSQTAKTKVSLLDIGIIIGIIVVFIIIAIVIVIIIKSQQKKGAAGATGAGGGGGLGLSKILSSVPVPQAQAAGAALGVAGKLA